MEETASIRSLRFSGFRKCFEMLLCTTYDRCAELWGTVNGSWMFKLQYSASFPYSRAR